MSPRIVSRQIYKLGQIRIARSLPFAGEILVAMGQSVQPNDAIGQVTCPGELVVVDVARTLGLSGLDLAASMRKLENDTVEAGEIIAERPHRFEFMSRVCRAPVTGRLAALAGHCALLETSARREVVKALLTGRVVDVQAGQGVVIETVGTLVEAACSLGRDAHGVLQLLSDDPTVDLTPDRLPVFDQRTILLVGGTVSAAVASRLSGTRLAGVIAGSMDAELPDLAEPPPCPIIATEGFGSRPMRRELFELLRSRVGDTTAMFAGARSSRAGRPPTIVIPLRPGGEGNLQPSLTGRVRPGSRVRLLRDPQALAWGRVEAIPAEPQVIETGLAYYGAVVDVEGKKQFVPWFNLEQIG